MAHLETRVREMQDQLLEAQRKVANPTFDEVTLTTRSDPRARQSCEAPTKRRGE